MKDRNKNRKGYKKTKVGWIPRDWFPSSLQDVSNGLRAGVSVNSIDQPSRLNEYGVLKTSCVTYKVFRPEENKRIVTEEISRARVSPRKGGIIISRMNTPLFVGANAYVDNDYPYLMLPDRLWLMEVLTETSTFPLWLGYLMSSEKIRSTMCSRATGTSGSMKNITKSDVLSIPIPLPPLPEQIAIASVLECWDKAIQKYEEKIEKKKNIKKGLMQKLLSGEQRLPGFDGEWHPVPLGNTADPKKRWSFTGGPFGSNLKSSSYTKNGVRIIQLQNIGDGVFHNDSKIYTSPEKADELISCNIFPGDLILSKMGDPVARACIIPDIEDRFLMCSDGIRLSVNEDQFDPFFVYSVINARVFRNKAHRSGTGSTRRRIGLTTLRVLSLYCPSLPEQKAIASVLSSADSEIKALEKKLALLRDQKKYLLNNLVTGTIRLPDFCKEVG